MNIIKWWNQVNCNHRPGTPELRPDGVYCQSCDKQLVECCHEKYSPRLMKATSNTFNIVCGNCETVLSSPKYGGMYGYGYDVKVSATLAVGLTSMKKLNHMVNEMLRAEWNHMERMSV